MENQIKNGYVKLQKPTMYRRTVAKTERHLLDIDLNHLDVDKLLMYKKGIPSGYMLRVIDRKMFEELIHQKVKSKKKSWLSRRLDLFLEIITNANRFNAYGYCSMHSFLINTVWAHFFRKEIVL